MKKYFTYICGLLLIISSCKNFQQGNSSIIRIDIEKNTENMQTIGLSSFTDDVHYVPLETRENLLISYITDFDTSQDLILVSDMNVCLLYKIDGNFILKVGNKGRGPGEYPYITNVNLGKSGEIYLSDTEDLYEYNVNGLFINKYINIFLNDNYYLSSWIMITDSLLFGHVPNSTGKEDHKALLIDRYGNIKQYYKNYIRLERDKRIGSTLEDYAHITKFKGDIFYKELFNDTLFNLSVKHQLLPAIVFKLGKYKVSESAREIMNFNEIFKFIYVNNVYQTDNKIFLTCDFGDNFPVKRLTQKKPPAALSGAQYLDRYGWYNTHNALGVYDKRSGSLIFSKPTSTDNPLFTSGLYNDIDAGPRFFPQKQVNDSTMVMWVNADELKAHVSSNDFKNNVPKYPEKKQKLEELANRLSESDNPVLMFVTFKK
jgi:hypothetical protein